jgi:UDP-N-acetyl-D-mannosaminuronic acid dehydrogenase
LGYIGLPTSGVLAANGFQVLGIDIQKHVVDTINKGQIHIHEPGLEDVIREAVTSGKFRATTKPEPCDIFIIAVPTPFKEQFAPDISYVESATALICPVLKAGDLLILESTVPVGCTERMAEIVREKRPDLFAGTRSKMQFAHCPERVLPGQILKELIANARVVGGLDETATMRACEFYRHFVKGEVVPTDARTAELCKLSENSFRDVNIAFANELSMVCEKLGIDVWELIELANRHPRVKILQPGPGVGGHCIPVDPWFIVSSAPKEARLIRTSREVNTAKTHRVVDQVKTFVKQSGQKSVACLGLAFKPNVDDFRESPAMEIVEDLAKDKNLKIHVVEPYANGKMPAPLDKRKNVQLTDLENAFRKCDVVVLLVDHKEFSNVTATGLAGKSIVDTRGTWRQQLKTLAQQDSMRRKAG